MKEIDDPDSEEKDDQLGEVQDDSPETDGHIVDESTHSHAGKVRRRIKVRKKIRVRKKPSVKKKLRTFAEKAFWVVLVAGFIAAMIVMIVELDIKDEKFKQSKKSGTVKIYF